MDLCSVCKEGDLMSQKYYGKYRGKVYNTNDPNKCGRIRCYVPSVFGDNQLSGWCTPCIPCAYDKGGDFFLPRVNDTVWIEFEEGNPNLPIWTGNWFSENKTPLGSKYTDTRVISWGNTKITLNGSSISINQNGNILTLNAQDINFLSRIKSKDLAFLALNANNIKNLLGNYRYWSDDKR